MKSLDLGKDGLSMVRFSLGQVVMTQGVNNLIEMNGEFAKFVAKSFVRHCNGDWGDLCEEDKEMNDSGLKYGNDRLFSRYENGEWCIYIITEWDRSATTILFPNEY